jgi:hypothetical protein
MARKDGHIPALYQMSRAASAIFDDYTQFTAFPDAAHCQIALLELHMPQMDSAAFKRAEYTTRYLQAAVEGRAGYWRYAGGGA